MKLKFLIFNFSFLILTVCGASKPVATTHTERIEQHVMPVAVGADTIEIVLSHTDNILHTERTDNTEYAVATPAEDRYKLDVDTACRVPTIESVRSTRALSMTKITTDTTSTLRITLQPDTVFVPYTHHIRSDTIVVPDRVCQQKLNHSNMTNLFLILILIAIFIIYLRKSIAHRQ